MSRKIKDIKDKNTGELVYPRTHASAVVLSSDSTLEDLVEVKQDKIDDLDEIRAGAAKGATALQSIPSEYITETELSNKGYATISALNNKVDTINGKQLSTEDFTTALKNKLEGLNNYDDTELSNAVETLRGDFDNIVNGDTTTAIKTFNEVIAFLDGLTDTQDLESIIASIEQQIAGKMDKVTLATVATSGSYNDLTNKPTIPSAVTESTVSGWGFTKNTGTYSKPSGGIPKSDLASAVQTSLGKADTALQSYTEQYKGTITGIKMNGVSKGTGGEVDLGTVITDISGKQDKLISGTNIKTINGNSILGSGDITISGGSSSDVYVTDFTMQDIINLLDGSADRCDMAKNSLISAIENNRRIIVPCGVSEVGYYHVEGYVDDLLYLLIVSDQRGIEFITIETSLSNSYCTLDEIYTTKLPRKVSELSNDSNFISSNGLKTINGESIVGSGDITISGGSSNANVQAVATGDVIDDVTVNYATTAYVDGLVGDINSILESIINGGGYGESKPINYGHIQSTNGTTYTIQFDLPVASDLEVDCGDANYVVFTGKTTAANYTLGPGENIGNTATVSPDEDETYIYKIIIE